MWDDEGAVDVIVSNGGTGSLGQMTAGKERRLGQGNDEEAAVTLADVERVDGGGGASRSQCGLAGCPRFAILTASP